MAQTNTCHVHSRPRSPPFHSITSVSHARDPPDRSSNPVNVCLCVVSMLRVFLFYCMCTILLLKSIEIDKRSKQKLKIDCPSNYRKSRFDRYWNLPAVHTVCTKFSGWRMTTCPTSHHPYTIINKLLYPTCMIPRWNLKIHCVWSCEDRKQTTGDFELGADLRLDRV